MTGFHCVSEEELLRAWLFRVDRLHLVDPAGQAFERVVMRHPGAVTVVPVHDDGTVSLVRQYRAAVDAMVLEIPAGTRDRDGESAEVTARRELAEEAGLEATTWEALVETWNTPGVSDQHTTIFLATGLSPCESKPDGVEEGYMTVERIRLADVDALVTDGTLKDETTVLGLYMARVRLRGRGPHGMSDPLPRPAEEYLSWLQVERGRSPRTLASYRRDLASYETTLDGRGSSMAAATPADVAAHLAALRRAQRRGIRGTRALQHPGLPPLPGRGGPARRRPDPRRPPVSVTDLLPKALTEEETERLLGRWSAPAPPCCGTGHCSRSCTAPAPA